METPAHELLAAWESFYVIVGSSAAALTGLQFVVMALVADSPGLRSADSIGAYGTPTVVHFCVCLFVSALLSAPWESLTPITWLLVAAGIVGVLYTLIVMQRARRQASYHPVAEDWVWHSILPLIAYSVLIGGAVQLHDHPTAGLFLPGAVTLVLLFIGIHNAWDTVAYVAVQGRATPGD